VSDSTTLIIDCTSTDGYPIATVSLGFGVVDHAVYVSADKGNDSYPGTAGRPKRTIQAGLDVAEALYSQAEVKVAEGQYIIATSDPDIVLTQGIKLAGGYAKDDWMVRDASVYASSIVSTRDSNVGALVTAMNCSSVAIDGLTMSSTDNGSDLTIIKFDTVNDFTISNCTISGIATRVEFTSRAIDLQKSEGTLTDDVLSTATHQSYNTTLIAAESGSDITLKGITLKAENIMGGQDIFGLDLSNSKATVTSLTATFSGSLANFRGICLDGGSTLTLTGSAISFLSTDAASFSNGIHSANSKVLVVRSTISFSTSRKTLATGIFCNGGSLSLDSVKIRIDTGAGTDEALALFSLNALSLSNSIFSSAYPMKLCYIDGCPSARIYNCLFECDKCPTTMMLVVSGSAGASVENNIFLGQAFRTVALSFDSAANLPSALCNNDFWVAYRFLATDDGLAAADISTLESVLATHGVASRGGNVAVAPSLSSDGNYSPTSSTPISVSQGGADVSSIFTSDMTGAMRTTPWSIGPYERD